jgi:hypothetical protein
MHELCDICYDRGAIDDISLTEYALNNSAYSVETIHQFMRRAGSSRCQIICAEADKIAKKFRVRR